MFTFININLWLHILSAITWIGSIFFTWWVLTPGIKASCSPEEAVFRIVSLERRFRKIAHPVIALITITGVLNLMSSSAIEKFKTSPQFEYLVACKIILLGLMIFAHIVRHNIYARKILSTAENRKTTGAGLEVWKKSENVLVLQAVMGVILVFLGINLR